MNFAFSDMADGKVLVARRERRRQDDSPGMDFYLIVILDVQARRCLVRSVDGHEFWSPWWAYDTCITQRDAEGLGAKWRVAPQQRPGLVGPSRHPPSRTNKEQV